MDKSNLDNQSEKILTNYFSKIGPATRTSEESSKQADNILSILKEKNLSEKSDAKVFKFKYSSPVNWIMRHQYFAYSSAAVIVLGLVFIFFGNQRNENNLASSKKVISNTNKQDQPERSLLADSNPENEKITTAFLSTMILNLDSRAFGKESSTKRSDSQNYNLAKNIIINTLKKKNINIAEVTENKITTDWNIITVGSKYYNSRLISKFSTYSLDNVKFYIEKYELKDNHNQNSKSFSVAEYKNIIKSIKKNYYSR